MNSKVLIAGVLGGLTLFLIGYLVYGILLADSMEGAPCMRSQDDLNILMIGVGNLFSGFLLAYIFSRWATISTFSGGAMAGAVIGFLMSAAYDFIMYGTTTCMDGVTSILMDVGMTTVMTAIAGGVVGWWLGRK